MLSLFGFFPLLLRPLSSSCVWKMIVSLPLLAFVAGSLNSVIAETVLDYSYILYAEKVPVNGKEHVIGLLDAKSHSFTKADSPEDSSLEGQWCIGLRGNDILLPCFQFYSGDVSQFLKGGRINIHDESSMDLSVHNDPAMHHIEVSLFESADIPNPSLKLKVTSPEVSNTKPIVKPKKARKIVEKVKEDEGNEEGASEFQEVVMPSASSKDGKTFFERNWKFVLPPLVLMILMGFANDPNRQLNNFDMHTPVTQADDAGSSNVLASDSVENITETTATTTATSETPKKKTKKKL